MARGVIGGRVGSNAWPSVPVDVPSRLNGHLPIAEWYPPSLKSRAAVPLRCPRREDWAKEPDFGAFPD
jgi:hypothetical protein